jgi:glycosyltransferase involved in cell wall biosynthesis
MRIAVVAPIEETIPPQKYGGIEWIVYHVANQLGQHYDVEVDLYASSDSEKSKYYNLIPIWPQSIRVDKQIGGSSKLRESAKLLSAKDAYQMLSKQKYDLIHNHLSWRFFIFHDDKKISCPIATTHHGSLGLDYQRIVFERYQKYPHISISDNQRNDFPSLNFVSTIYNGIDTDQFCPATSGPEKKQDYMFFLARMSEQKGAIEAAKVAHKLGIKLVVAAKVDVVDQPYYEQFKKLVDNKNVEFIGEIDFETKLKHLREAKLLIAPIKWEEPFGLMFTEAMACGTPVVAFARGAAPEIIEDNKNGYLINQTSQLNRGKWAIQEFGAEGLEKAVEAVFSSSQSDYLKMCQLARSRVVAKFSTQAMVKQYFQLFKKIVS